MAKKATEEPVVPSAPASPMPPSFPPFSQTPMGQRLMQTNGAMPVWANPTTYSSRVTPTATLGAAPMQTPMGPPAPPPLPDAKAAPTAMPMTAEETGIPGQTSLRDQIMRTMYRDAKRLRSPVSETLMARTGVKPPVEAVDPLAGLTPEPEEPPRYLDNRGNTAPPTKTLDPNATHYGGEPEKKNQMPGRVGRRMAERGAGRSRTQRMPFGRKGQR